jgi:hypothetical protein
LFALHAGIAIDNARLHQQAADYAMQVRQPLPAPAPLPTPVHALAHRRAVDRKSH